MAASCGVLGTVKFIIIENIRIGKRLAMHCALIYCSSTALFPHAKPPYPSGASGSPNLQGYAARAVVHAKCDSASGGSHACRTHSARDACSIHRRLPVSSPSACCRLCTNRRLCSSLHRDGGENTAERHGSCRFASFKPATIDVTKRHCRLLLVRQNRRRSPGATG